MPPTTILITGPPGCGKTTLVAELRAHGYQAADTDDLSTVVHWIDDQGREAARPSPTTTDWLRKHHFVWRRDGLRAWMAEQAKPIFLCGLAENMFDCLDLFDRAYYLQLPDATSMERLSRGERTNPLGKDLRQRQLALAMKRTLDRRAHEESLIQLDATAEPVAIVETLLVGLALPEPVDTRV